ncbi:hypothetical protein BDV29DRAFT_156615 [Aspergillus leporis]|jgi:hypothetical protein|uniref:Major facilitator superfamily domain-containing protein n=1 Tax=Aspergillus leporis TaxID=41062 RepID=A0A5N5X592_9EURO|nr:hypothetical protein BDV29DRAFT_156615 [Aspergillus leporis]
MLILRILAYLTITSNAPKRRSCPPLLLRVWKSPTYTTQVAGIFLVMWTLFVPFFYIPSYTKNIGLTTDLSNYLISILNAASLFGRLAGGAIATTSATSTPSPIAPASAGS